MLPEELCRAGPQSPDFEWSLWLHAEAGLQLQRRRSLQEAVAHVQLERMVAWTRLLAASMEKSGSFKRELGSSFIRI